MLSGWVQCGSSGLELNVEGQVAPFREVLRNLGQHWITFYRHNTDNSKSIMSFRDMKHGALPLWLVSSTRPFLDTYCVGHPYRFSLYVVVLLTSAKAETITVTKDDTVILGR